MADELTALLLCCSLKSGGEPSSSELLAKRILSQLETHGVTGEVVRVVDEHVAFGVSIDEGNGDGWPALRDRMLAADILVMATPIWMGQPASVAKVVLERLDAELSEADDEGRLLTFGKVAVIGVVGNEDGAHHVIAECAQALNVTGFSLAANAGTYWVGEAMQTTDYRDLDVEPREDGVRNQNRRRQRRPPGAPPQGVGVPTELRPHRKAEIAAASSSGFSSAMWCPLSIRARVMGAETQGCHNGTRSPYSSSMSSWMDHATRVGQRMVRPRARSSRS